jgi:phosphoribosylformimino-5-aminoimidazole carboxamide ribotide isomerase
MGMAIPSIDLISGKAVRLRQGKQGTERVIHIVDLDAAFGRKPQLGMLPDLQRVAGNMRIQWAGGMRSCEAAEAALSSGAKRVVFGTALFKSRQEVYKAVQKFGSEKIWVSLDFAGKPPIAKISGWEKSTGIGIKEAVAAAMDCGIGGIILSSVDEDGMGGGPDISLVSSAQKLTDLPLWLAGGMRSAADARAAFSAGAAGAIFGSALYNEKIDLGELACLQGE